MYNIERIISAANDCSYYESFVSNVRRCETAITMGGLMAINAECFLDALSEKTDAEIKEYVSDKYKPGILDPFKGTSLYIKKR